MFDISDIGLNLVRRIQDLWRGGRSESLIDYTRPMRVEPIVVIDNSILFHDMLPDLMQTLQSLFSGYYAQAIAISTSIGKIEVHRHLDRLNPSRRPSDSAVDTAGWLVAQENYQIGLPTKAKRVALESLSQMIEDDRERETAAGFGRDTAKELKEITNLSVGKMLMVEITDGLHKGTFPVSIRLLASSMPTTGVIHILTNEKQDTSVKERYHAWRSGQIEFIRDFVFCIDLIEARRKNLMADKDGLYTKMLERRRNNQLSAIVSANPSVANASNMVVVSENTIKEAEREIGGRFSDFKTREAMLKETTIMIVAVVDTQYDRVTFYSRGIPETTEVSARDLKSANKGNGPDVSDILKAYQVGSSPSL